MDWRFFDQGKKGDVVPASCADGFDVKNPNYSVDPPWLVNLYAHRLLNDAAEGDDDLFVRMVQAAVEKAPK